MIKRVSILLLLSLITVSALFAAGPLAFKDLIQNYPNVEDQYNWDSYQRGTYLIIGADAVFTNPYMELFRVFKERQGFRVTMAPLSETGTSQTAIHEYISDYAATNPLEYVLLIGDVNGAYALPSFSYGSENDVTDLPYVLLDGPGDDYYPEAFIGRWPVDTAQELAKVIGRTIKYAQDPDVESGYLERALVTAGNYADSGIILTPVWTSLWLYNELNDFGYTEVDTVFFPPTTGPEQILETWNNGVGIVNYRGWGDAHGWHFPHFHVSDFDDGNLSNGNKLPIVFSFVCGTGKFDSSIDPSFCEALLTQGSINLPAGAVAVVAPSDLHTRTKFNNALNSKLWDALLEGHVNELAPALLASKFGFTDEFVNELDPGQMAEFYFHTYNILGDPSLPLWLGTPEPINLTAADLGNVSEDNGRIILERPDLQEGVFALRQADAIVGSGRWTDGHIRIYRYDGASFYDPANPTAPLEITLNSADHVPVTVELEMSSGAGLAFAGMEEELHAGMTAWTPRIHNYGSSRSVNVTLRDPGATYVEDFGSVLLPGGATTSLAEVAAPVIAVGQREILMELEINGVVLPLAIPVYGVAPALELTFSNGIRPLPDSNFSLTLSGAFEGMQSNGSDIHVTMTSAADFVTLDDVTGTASLDADGTLLFSDDAFSGTIGPVAHGSRLPLTFHFYLGNQPSAFYSKQVVSIVGALSSTDPTPPRLSDGYWAYDNTDAEYPEVPTYDWVDLSAQPGAVMHTLGDDDHELVDLPFSFKYYDVDYDEMTLNSNGWASFGPDYINYFRNWSIPMPLGPDAMLAPFWDDLDNDTLVNGQEEARPIFLYSYHDQAHSRYIIEWHEVWNGFGDRSFLETFQIHLYDPAALSADDGNGVIEFHYFEVNDVDEINNYSTVGIESPDQNDGLMYVYALNYAPGAAELAAGRAIRFTRNPPEFYVADVKENIQAPQRFYVGAAYPNPFNGFTTLPIRLEQGGDLDLEVYDLRGRLIRSERMTALAAGEHRYVLSTDDLSSGVYLLRFISGLDQQIRKVTLLK